MPPQARNLRNDNDLLTQILEVLQNSTIAEERGQDALSKFWAAYKKVSGEYDGDMLERCNGNMDIVLIFAGLFSAVNTAFIIAMQPNPLDTTNTLLLHLIQISLNGPSAVQPTTLSASTSYSTTNFWIQALAFASLAFSLLAAFGAVLGKQWLGYYKTNCYGRGSLEARCKQRHRKFQTLQSWQFQNVLQSFPMLLQMSLLLFGLSLGIWMWTQQQAISMLILATTGFGLLFHVFTILISVLSPDCPFQTPISLAIQAILRHFRASAGLQSPGGDSIASAMQWILETSTNPDVVRSAVELMPAMSKLPDVNIVSLCGDVRDMFQACFDHRGLAMLQDSALAYGQALIHFSWNNPDARHMLHDSIQGWNLWESWRTLYFSRVLEQCRISYIRMRQTDNAVSRGHHQADTRTALRMAVATGLDEFTHPNDERLVWDGQFRLHHFESKADRDMFIYDLFGCVEHFYGIGDLDVAGDALLLASGIMTTSYRYPDADICKTICRNIIPLFSTTHQLPSRWRCVALGSARRFLKIHPYLRHDESLLQVVLMAICPPANSTIQNAGDEDEVQFTSAIDLLNFSMWPKGHVLELSPLSEIQRLVLLVLPTPTVDKVVKYTPYCRVLIRLIGTDNPPALRHFALRIASNARKGLALVAAAGCDESQRDMVLSELSPVLLSVANDSSIPMDYLADYFRLISALARSPDWRHSLITDGHVERCITMITETDERGVADFHLAGFFLCISPPGQDASCCGCITNEQWWSLMKMAWHSIADFSSSLFDYDDGDDGDDDDTMEIIRTLVRGTETYMPQDLSKDDLESLSECLGEVLDRLSSRNSEQTVISAAGLKDMVDGRWEAISE